MLEWSYSRDQVGKKKLSPWELWALASLWPELTYNASQCFKMGHVSSQSAEVLIGPLRDQARVSDSARCMLGILLPGAGKMGHIIT